MYCIVLCSVVEWSTVQYGAVQYILWCSIVQYSIVQYGAVQYGIISYCIISYCIISYCIICHSFVQFIIPALKFSKQNTSRCLVCRLLQFRTELNGYLRKNRFQWKRGEERSKLFFIVPWVARATFRRRSPHFNAGAIVVRRVVGSWIVYPLLFGPHTTWQINDNRKEMHSHK